MKKYYAGLDLGGTFVKGGIVDEEGKILVKDKIPTGRERPYTEIAADMARLVKDLAARAGLAEGQLAGVGIGSPGLIDAENGVIVYSNNIRWENVPLCGAVREQLGVPVCITNDANAAALGEHFCGAGKKFGSMVFITLGTGVGGGIILDGKLFEGNRSAGAEIGHMVIERGGWQCTCGRRGCFEAYASATGLIRRTRESMEAHKESAMWKIAGSLEGVDGRTAFDGMRAGDAAAKQVVEEYISCLAEGVTNLVNIFRPEAVVLGGGVCAEGETLLAPLRAAVEPHLFGGAEYAPVAIVAASLGNDAGLCGAARLAMQRAR